MKHKSALTASSLMLVLVGCQSEEISKNNVADMVNIAEEKYKNKTVTEIVDNSGDLASLKGK